MKFKSFAAINQRIESITPHHLVIGIDIAKETHVAGAVNYRGVQLGRTLSFGNHADGFEKFQRWVKDTQKTYGLTQVILGVESTGHYFRNLGTWLRNRGEQVVLVNPLTTKRNKENWDNRPSKNDAKDAIIIADAISRGYYSEWRSHDPVYRRLRGLVNEREALTTDLTALGNQIQTALDEGFPEFTSVFKEWDGTRALATLKAFPLPADLRELSVDSIIEGWRESGMKRAGGSSVRKIAARLLATARRSVGITDFAGDLKRRIGRLLERYEALQNQIVTLEGEIESVLQEVPHSARHPLETVGLSPLFIATLLANAGDLSRYEHGRQLLALAGLNLAESTSGKRKGQIVLSKRGRRQLRKLPLPRRHRLGGEPRSVQTLACLQCRHAQDEEAAVYLQTDRQAGPYSRGARAKPRDF
jgi:transposase